MENAITIKDWRNLLGNRLLEPKERNTYIQFHFINPSKPSGFGYETCPQDLIKTIKRKQIKT
jgi:hypothetical protein